MVGLVLTYETSGGAVEGSLDLGDSRRNGKRGVSHAKSRDSRLPESRGVKACVEQADEREDGASLLKGVLFECTCMERMQVWCVPRRLKHTHAHGEQVQKQ